MGKNSLKTGQELLLICKKKKTNNIFIRIPNSKLKKKKKKERKKDCFLCMCVYVTLYVRYVCFHNG